VARLAVAAAAGGELGSGPLTDPDLAAHITTLRARGRVLLGAPIHEVFPEVPDADFREAILADLEWIRHHSTQIYGVLNACRVLAYLSGEGVLSKAEAVDWALRNLPAAHRATIATALSAYRKGADEPCAPHEVRGLSDGRRHERTSTTNADVRLGRRPWPAI
jgi:hypothetical protein